MYATSYTVSTHSCLDEAKKSQPQVFSDDVVTDGNNKKTHYHANCKKVGYIVYTVSKYVATYICTYLVIICI